MSRSKSRAPDKGSFPLDHFHECQEEAKLYSACLDKHGHLPKRCREMQKKYLECRMDKGLMKRESMEKLGFTPDLEWETEEQEKKALFDRIQQMKLRAYGNVMENIKREEGEGDSGIGSVNVGGDSIGGQE